MAEPTTDIIPVTNGEEAPELTPPVEIPEYYTGFGTEFEQVGVELQAAYKRLQTADKKLAQPLAVHAVGGLGNFGWFVRTGLKVSPLTYIIEALIPGEAKEEAMKVLAAEAAAEFDAAARDMQVAEWKQEVMQVLPVYLSDSFYTIEKPEDILQHIAPGTDLSDADTAWLNQLYERMEHLSNVLPEDFQGDVMDAQSKIINEILTEPKVELKGVHRLTVDEIAKAFTFGVTDPAQFGLTPEDIRGMLSKFDLDDEELKSQREWLAERAREWEVEAARMNLIRSGTILAETPELAPLEWAKLIVTQPMMATVELLQKWWDKTSRPTSAAISMNLPAPVAGAAHGAPLGAMAGAATGAIIGAFGGPIGVAAGALIGLIAGTIGGAAWFGILETDIDKELTQHFEFYKGQGESDWSAYAKAFNEWDAPWWKKAILDSAYDPLNWIGWGAISGVGKKLGAMALPRGLKWMGTRVGPWMVAFEQGYVAGADAVFRGATHVVAAPIKSAFWLTGAGYTIPATFTQMSRNFAAQGYMNVRAVMGRSVYRLKGSLVGATADDVMNAAGKSIRATLDNPLQGNDVMVKAGAPLLEFPYLDDVAAAKFVKAAAGDIMFDAPRLARFNSRLADAFSGQVPSTGEPINRIVAGNMLADLGINSPATKAVNSLATKLAKFKEDVASNAMAAFKSETALGVFDNIYDHLFKTRYGNLHSPLTKYMQQAGRSASWHSRVADKVLYSARLVSFERKAVMPFAKHQLLFSNFGPYNYLENTGRSFVGGAEIMNPKNYGGIDETLDLLGGLRNVDYDLVMAQRGMKRLTQSFVDPGTGKTAVFKGGKIPFITKRVRIPEKIPRWGGNYIGQTFTIGDQRFFIGSSQDWYDMWGKLTIDQTGFDTQIHFLKALDELAPVEMGAIHKLIQVDTKPLLNKVTSLSKREAFDVAREMKLKIIGGGPDAARALADIDVITLQRRILNMRLNRDIMDKAEDIHGIIKRGMNDEVLDGTMFTKGHASIDDRVNAFMEASRELEIASLAPQINTLNEQVDWFIKNPPRNLDDFMWDIDRMSSNVAAVGETIHDFRRLTRLRVGKLTGIEVDNFEVGSAKMLAEYMDVAEDEIVKMMNQLMDNAKGVKAIVEEIPSLKAINAATTTREAEDLFKPISAISDTYEKRLQKYMPNLQEDSVLAKIYADNARITAGPVSVESWQALARNEVKTIKRIQELLPKAGPILDDVQLARLTDLDTTTRLELNNWLATRTKLNGIEAEIPDFHKSIRKMWQTDPDGAFDKSKKFWDSQKARKADVWDEFDGVADRLKSDRLLLSREFLMSVDRPVFVPEFVPEVTGELTANHLAYIYGATGDDLYRGLTRVSHYTRIRPRKDFIIHTRDYANAYAAKFGKTADQMGFTDEAIGEVYDQMWRSLGIDPNKLAPDSPTMLQMEEVRQEIHRLYDATKIPESDVVNWKKYTNAVADGAEQLPQFKGAPILYHGTTSRAAKTIGVEGFKKGSVRTGAFGNGVYFYKSADALESAGKYFKYPSTVRATSVAKNTYLLDLADPDDYFRMIGMPRQDLSNIANEDLMSYPWMKNIVRELKSRGYDSVDLRFSSLPIDKEDLFRIWGGDQVIVFSSKDVSVVTGKIAEPAISGTPDWWAKKEAANAKGKELHFLSYPDYNDANMIDETMRAIFPFWTYELFRWKWLPRTFMRTPGVMSNLGRFMEYTDQGYIPVPGTDLQINPLRGTVFMGGLRSFYLRDFPEFHDPIPGIEFLDYIGRAGFFPGIHVMLPVIGLSSMASGEKFQWGELAPAWVKSGLSALRALSPEHIGKVLDIVYPDRFRDYMTMMQLASIGYDGDEIWRKRQQNIKLTEEEEKLWLQAVNKVDGIKGILMNQTGLFRIRPDEFSQIRKEMRLAIEEATGVPVRTQDWIDKMYPVTGKRFSDYFHLDIQQQSLLYQWESFRRYQGITTPLYPSSWQTVDIKRNEYYAELEDVYSEVRYLGRYDEEGNILQPSIVDINRQLVEGVIGPSQWKSIRNDIQDGLSEAVRILGDSPAYKDVPKTFEEMAAMLEERGQVTPTQTPDQELMYYYFELKPELKYNWESGRMELDYETYYAYIDILLESLTPAFRERLMDRIQNDWTPMERLYWEFSRTYARPYRNIRDIVLREYTDEQVQIIRRFEVARGTERQEILEVMGPDGKLISGYQKRLREARQRLRIIDPELDAWLYFFGTTDKWMSHESEEIYNNLTEQYLIPAMIGEAK